MRLMFFYDLENFRKSLAELNPKNFYDIGKFQFFLINFLCENLKFACSRESLIRTYAYTGEYTEAILNKIKKETEQETDNLAKEKKIKFQERCIRNYNHQKSLFEAIKHFSFFELRTFPLKYEDGKVFQKGVDVQLAVDLVSHAFQDSFDIAVICSGDIDLLGSIHLVKNLGKRIIIASHPLLMSKKLRESADYFINFSKFTQEQINYFSKPFVKNQD